MTKFVGPALLIIRFLFATLNTIAAAGFPRWRRLAFQEELPCGMSWIQG